MTRTSGVRAVVLAILLTAFVPWAALAAPGEAGAPPPRGGVIAGFGEVWQVLVSLFTPLGSIMDPNGVTGSGDPHPGDSGSIMDPDGSTAEGETFDLGSIMDPDG